MYERNLKRTWSLRAICTADCSAGMVSEARSPTKHGTPRVAAVGRPVYHICSQPAGHAMLWSRGWQGRAGKGQKKGAKVNGKKDNSEKKKNQTKNDTERKKTHLV